METTSKANKTRTQFLAFLCREFVQKRLFSLYKLLKHNQSPRFILDPRLFEPHCQAVPNFLRKTDFFSKLRPAVSVVTT